jgi:CHASE2 domain-containing sensor protein/tRNA A-37 threonylcarbamoyl transferase component Bud32
MNYGPSTSTFSTAKLWAAISLVIIALLIVLISRFTGLENRAYDYFQQYQYKSASDQILLVTVDSRVKKYQDFWKGPQFGELAAALNDMGAKLIVATQPVNMPEVPSIEQIEALEELQQQEQRASGIQDPTDPLTRQVANLRKQYDEREKLADQLTKANNIVLSAHITDFEVADYSAIDCNTHEVNLKAIEKNLLGNVNRARFIAVPPAKICNSVRSIGLSNFWADDDGVIRRANLVVNVDGTFLPSIALSANAAIIGNNHDIIVAANNALSLGDQIIHTGSGLEILNRYYAGALGKPAFNEVSAHSVLTGRANSADVQGRIVMIGEVARGAVQGLATPVDPQMPPLLIMASMLSNLIEGDFLLRPDWLPIAENAVLILILLLTLLWVPAMPAIGAAIMGLTLGMLILSIQAWFLVSEGIWVQLSAAAIFAMLGIWSAHAIKSLLRGPVQPERLRRAAARTHGASEQDQLDLEFSVLRQQAPTEETKEKMYDIAMIHGKAKEYARAEKVLIHIAKLDQRYKDVSELLEKLSGARKKGAVRRKPKAGSGGALDRRTLGRYEIDRVLGRGAMATVYLGRDPAISRKVAIKTVALAKEFDEAELKDAKLQFRREAESAGRLNHPNIIAIYDAGEDDDVSYLAMEYFEGASLLENSTPDNLLPAKWVLELAARAAEALDYAHRQNVVHRDVKPANLMYHAATDTLKLTDFGIARLTDSSRTKTGIILGTPSYMSPEQLSAAGVTGQSDLYSLGVTMYQLLTGNAPFRADSIPKLMDKIINEDHTPIASIRNDVPPCVDAIVTKCMAKDPQDRFPNGREMAMALRDCAKNFN